MGLRTVRMLGNHIYKGTSQTGQVVEMPDFDAEHLIKRGRAAPVGLEDISTPGAEALETPMVETVDIPESSEGEGIDYSAMTKAQLADLAVRRKIYPGQASALKKNKVQLERELSEWDRRN